MRIPLLFSSVDFYAGEITALLGHNGAGKSTTMNILTGMIEPTSGAGVVAIGGQDLSIWSHMPEIRKGLGFCPQYDIVYPELSVVDHMRFYGQCKGIPSKEVKIYYEDVFAQMEMLHALKTPAAKLSGGMKRKLSIAIALLGDPEVIILDEPTSAIDPFSRRAIWDLVLRYRRRATVVISTHYMQEADVLGDRIAILDKGSLKTAGSPMYLKSRYGSGFKLILSHQSPIETEELAARLSSITEISLESSTATETVFGIPLEAARSPAMVEVFEHLDDNKSELGIVSYGISESTMEQVFFRVAEGDALDTGEAEAEERKRLFDSIQYRNATGASLGFMQTAATWLKRFHLARKSVLVLIFQVLAPLLFACFILLFFKTIGKNDNFNGETKAMHIWEYEPGNLIFYAADGSGTSGLQSALQQHGLGTRCTPGSNLKTKDDVALECGAETSTFPTSKAFNDSVSAQCTCDKCPDDAAGPAPVEAVLPSNDTLINLSGRNLTSFLIKSKRREDVYGGLAERDLQVAANGFALFGNKIATELGSPTNPLWKEMDNFFNGFPTKDILITTGVEQVEDRRPTNRERQMNDAQGSFLNALSSVFFRVATAGGKSMGIMLETAELSLNDEVSTAAAMSGILFGFFGALALMMPIFNVILVIVNEASSGNKTLQLLMGLSAVIYWVANFIWDALCFILSLLIMIAFMAIFPNDFKVNLGVFFATGLVYGLSMMLFSYVLSFIMKTARVTVLVVGLVAPFFSIAALILMAFQEKSWYNNINTGLNFFPPYFITDSLAVVSIQERLPEFAKDPLMSWKVLGKRYVMVALFAALMLVLLICFQSGMMTAIGESCWNCCCSIGEAAVKPEEEEGPPDPDVLTEERRIHQPEMEEQEESDKDLLLVKSLKKAYGSKKVAVRGVSFGVHPGECFGLLGVNGAGKSSLFKCLAGYQSPTAGDARIRGYSIFREHGKVARHMSYCPQEDVLYERLSPKEHLSVYALIRGIPAPYRSHIISALIDATGLTPHISKQSQALSGGNKRKLNFALSVLDFPDCIFLDEMTTGMDPKARRAAWDCLKLAINRGCSVIITSHSMEECEALCQRLVIMVNGRFKCIGGVQYLKDRFGNAYNLRLRYNPTVSPPGQLKSDLMEKLAEQNPKVVEEHPGYLEFELSAEGLRLSWLYRELGKMRSEGVVEEFSASQTTLEHVFVNMAKSQE